MHYKKLQLENLIIEFHNNWLGEESVLVNGQLVSKKSSITGADHHFTILENGSMARYVVTSKLDQGLNVYLDLRKNHKLIQENIPIIAWGKEHSQQNKTSPYKNEGLKKLKEYKIEGAIEDLLKALDKNLEDPEIYFHLACAYSILEDPEKGFESLENAIKYGLKNKENILTHEMLAFLRIHTGFDDFMEKNFKE